MSAALATELEARQTLDSYINSTLTRRSNRALHSPAALKESRSTFSDAIKKSTIKSDLKRSTAFIKKIKMNLTSANLPIITSDIETLNLTRHTSEVAQALFEAKIKPSDSASAVAVILELNKRYKDFLPTITNLYASVLKPEKDGKKGDVDPKERAR